MNMIYEYNELWAEINIQNIPHEYNICINHYKIQNYYNHKYENKSIILSYSYNVQQ